MGKRARRFREIGREILGEEIGIECFEKEEI